MRSLVLLVLLLAVLCLVSTTPINPKRLLINRPTEGSFLRARRSPQYVKGHAPAKGHNLSYAELNLRKGEYICGNKVCQLKPGEVPASCVHCQYKV